MWCLANSHWQISALFHKANFTVSSGTVRDVKERSGNRLVSSPKRSDQHWGSHSLLLLGGQWGSFLGDTRPGHEVPRSPRPSSEDQNEWSCISTPSCLHGVERGQLLVKKVCAKQSIIYIGQCPLAVNVTSEHLPTVGYTLQVTMPYLPPHMTQQVIRTLQSARHFCEFNILQYPPMLRGRLILDGIDLWGECVLRRKMQYFILIVWYVAVVGIRNLPIFGLPFFANHQTTNQTCQQNDN